MEIEQEIFTDTELTILAEETKMAEDRAELEQYAANGKFCVMFIGGLFLAAFALIGLLK